MLGAPIGNRETRARVGFLPEHFRFHDSLTARELLRFHGRLYGLRGPTSRPRIDRLLARVDLLDAADRPLRGYSKGMLQRAGLAQALLNDPALVFLDEPTSGLDPLGRLLVRDIMRELRDRGTSVFLNSHLLGEVEATCDRVAFVKQGRVVHDMHARQSRRRRRRRDSRHAARSMRARRAGAVRHRGIVPPDGRGADARRVARRVCPTCRAGSSNAAHAVYGSQAAASRSRSGSSR